MNATCDTCGATFDDGITAGHHEIDHRKEAVRAWDHSFACGIHDDKPCTCKEDSPVSGATYRIDVEHQPDPLSPVQWLARITRLSDENQVGSLWATSPDEAEAKARLWLYAQNAKQPGWSLFVNDEGKDETPHSVKA